MRNQFSLRLGVLLIVAAVGLAACYLPEKFLAKINVERDQSYSFAYSGTVVNFMAAGMQKERGKLSDKDNAALEAEARKIASQPNVNKVIYIGNGRYAFDFEEKRKAGETLKVFDLFFVHSNKDSLTISSSAIDEKSLREISKIGFEIDGIVEVVLPKNAQVISHNATSTPFFGFGSYSWKIRSLNQLPAMQVRFAN